MKLSEGKATSVETVGELIDVLKKYKPDTGLECLCSNEVSVIEWKCMETDQVEMIELEDKP